MTETDHDWMRQALALAERGRGAVEPNPMVGAVVVRDGVCVGRGYHERHGQPHAEVNALAQAGEAARDATLYVTLEPCCHHGKTPPCTDSVLRAGIRRVVAAMSDPFPQVAGHGAALLRSAGVEVDIGVGEAEARRLNAPYLKLLNDGRPWVIAKWAMTLDGKIATRTGHSQWISNEASRRRVHELRGRVDGVLVGVGTALADDPLLTARPPGPRTATRIVLDSQARLPLDSQLVHTASTIPTLVVTSTSAPSLAEHGVEVLTLPCEQGRSSLTALLDELGRRRWTNLLVEGGAGVLGAFLDACLIDEVHVFLAPRLAGGRDALSAVGGAGVALMDQALTLTDVAIEQLDGDLHVRGLVLNR